MSFKIGVIIPPYNVSKENSNLISYIAVSTEGSSICIPQGHLQLSSSKHSLIPAVHALCTFCVRVLHLTNHIYFQHPHIFVLSTDFVSIVFFKTEGS